MKTWGERADQPVVQAFKGIFTARISDEEAGRNQGVHGTPGQLQVFKDPWEPKPGVLERQDRWCTIFVRNGSF
jgi:hypothetical protein